MANIAPIKMAMECGLFVALGFPHYFCGKIEFVWIIHHHSTDVVLSYSSRKSTRIMNIHGFLCIYIYTYISVYEYIYIYGHIYRIFHRISRSETGFCDHLPFQQQRCTKSKWENNGTHGIFFSIH
jgi:hypothetical protein